MVEEVDFPLISQAPPQERKDWARRGGNGGVEGHSGGLCLKPSIPWYNIPYDVCIQIYIYIHVYIHIYIYM